MKRNVNGGGQKACTAIWIPRVPGPWPASSSNPPWSSAGNTARAPDRWSAWAVGSPSFRPFRFQHMPSSGLTPPFPRRRFLLYALPFLMAGLCFLLVGR